MRRLLAVWTLLLAWPTQAAVVRLPAEAAPAPVFAVSAPLQSIAISPALPGVALVALPAAPIFTAPSSAAAKPANDDSFTPTAASVLREAGARAQASPDSVGALYDAAPSTPDLDALATVRPPEAPAPWRPRSFWLKPVATVVNAVAASKHRRVMIDLAPDYRLTIEELGARDALTAAHAALAERRLQDALNVLRDNFLTRSARRWYGANSRYAAYRAAGQGYMRFAEDAIKRAYHQAHARARDANLINEADAARRDGTLRGRFWRMTALQEKGSAHCALHALHNAISASAGFASPVTTDEFIFAARKALNRAPSGGRHAEAVKLFSLQNGYDAGNGMGDEKLAEWASVLGLKLASRGPPRDAVGWAALSGEGQGVLLGLRLFHEKFRLSEEDRVIHGHDHRVIRHAVSLLGSFVSPSRGVRLFMVQDSGSGATDFYTAEELSAVTESVQVLHAPAPAVLP